MRNTIQNHSIGSWSSFHPLQMLCNKLIYPFNDMDKTSLDDICVAPCENDAKMQELVLSAHSTTCKSDGTGYTQYLSLLKAISLYMTQIYTINMYPKPPIIQFGSGGGNTASRVFRRAKKNKTNESNKQRSLNRSNDRQKQKGDDNVEEDRNQDGKQPPNNNNSNSIQSTTNLSSGSIALFIDQLYPSIAMKSLKLPIYVVVTCLNPISSTVSQDFLSKFQSELCNVDSSTPHTHSILESSVAQHRETIAQLYDRTKWIPSCISTTDPSPTALWESVLSLTSVQTQSVLFLALVDSTNHTFAQAVCLPDWISSTTMQVDFLAEDPSAFNNQWRVGKLALRRATQTERSVLTAGVRRNRRASIPGPLRGVMLSDKSPQAAIVVLPHFHTKWCDRKRQVCTATDAVRELNRLGVVIAHLPPNIRADSIKCEWYVSASLSGVNGTLDQSQTNVRAPVPPPCTNQMTETTTETTTEITTETVAPIVQYTDDTSNKHEDAVQSNLADETSRTKEKSEMSTAGTCTEPSECVPSQNISQSTTNISSNMEQSAKSSNAKTSTQPNALIQPETTTQADASVQPKALDASTQRKTPTPPEASIQPKTPAPPDASIQPKAPPRSSSPSTDQTCTEKEATLEDTNTLRMDKFQRHFQPASSFDLQCGIQIASDQTISSACQNLAARLPNVNSLFNIPVIPRLQSRQMDKIASAFNSIKKQREELNIKTSARDLKASMWPTRASDQLGIGSEIELIGSTDSRYGLTPIDGVLHDSAASLGLLCVEAEEVHIDRFTYFMRASDVGRYIMAVVTLPDGTELVTQSVGPVEAVPPSIREIWIEGAAQVGETLQANTYYVGGKQGPSEFAWIKVNPDGTRETSDFKASCNLDTLTLEKNKESKDPRLTNIKPEDTGCIYKVSCLPIRNDGVSGAESTSRPTSEILPFPTLSE